jgi:hypothetical protein
MNGSHNVSESQSPNEPVSNVASIDDLATPEVLAIREARQHAVAARLAAEKAFREAEQAEASLLAQEQEAVASALSVRRERATEAARIAAEYERAAIDRVAALEVELQRCFQTKEHVGVAARSVMQSRDEAQVALDRLSASLAEFEDRLREAESNERRVELELAASRRSAEEMTGARERAEAAIPPVAAPAFIDLDAAAAKVTVPAPIPAVTAAVWPTTSDVGDPFAIAALRAQRVAERRAADAARGQSN